MIGTNITPARYARENNLTIPEARAALRELEKQGVLVKKGIDFWQKNTGHGASTIQRYSLITGRDPNIVGEEIALGTLKRHLAWRDPSITAGQLALTAGISTDEMHHYLQRLVDKGVVSSEIPYRLRSMHDRGVLTAEEIQRYTQYTITPGTVHI